MTRWGRVYRELLPTPDAGAEHFGGLEEKANGIAPGLQSHVAARLKDEAVVDKQSDRAREARKLRAKHVPEDG